MSDEYRDDTQETAYISDSSWIELKVTTDEVARVTTALLFSLLVLQTDHAIASDDVLDGRVIYVEETAYISDAAIAFNATQQLVTDSLKVRDTDLSYQESNVLIVDEIPVSEQYDHTLTISTHETAHVSDVAITNKQSTILVTDKTNITDKDLSRTLKQIQIADNLFVTDTVFNQLSTLSIDHVTIDEHWQLQRNNTYQVEDKLKISDKAFLGFAVQSHDVVQINEQYENKLIASILCEDQHHISDDYLTRTDFTCLTEDNLTLIESITTHLIANNLLTDVLYIEDYLLGDVQHGFAWTANTDTWAMSRYDSYQFHDLTVIDGVLYGINEYGVFRVDADSEVNAKVVTGQLDIGQGQLVHPVAAYLEYQLSGSSKKLEVGVSTTQSGTKQTYYYPLPNEQADYLTNSRVLFGRGLRGRHFSFEFNISGQSGYINDLSIDLTPTKRRV